MCWSGQHQSSQSSIINTSIIIQHIQSSTYYYTVLAAGQECVHRQLVRGVQAGARCNSPDVSVSAYCLLGYFVLSGVENRRKKAILRRDSSSQQGSRYTISWEQTRRPPTPEESAMYPAARVSTHLTAAGRVLQQVESTAPRTTGWASHVSPHSILSLQRLVLFVLMLR
jgi:hypothetical protein